MTDNRTTDLLPCPFCGGNARLTTWTPTAASISCIMCGAHFNTYTEAEAITAWNTRTDYHGYEQAAIEAWKSIKAWNTRATHGTLTAEQVREAIYKHGVNDGSIYSVFKGSFKAIADELNAELGSEINGETSDGYHTFNELYHHRAVLFSVIVRDHRELAWKARKHHDGTMYDGMFIVGIETPQGQATYHYDVEPYWEMFDCEEREYAPEWDGHTSDEAIARIAELGSEPPYDELLRCLENDWYISASWDGLRKFWCIELTEDGVRLRDAELWSGTCVVTHDFKCSNCGKQIGVVRNCEMYETCDGQQAWKSLDHEVCDIPNFCPNCGAKVVKR